MNSKEWYFDITKVDGVTPEIIRVYKSLVRHERYLEEKDRRNKNYQYGYEEEIHHLLVRKYDVEDSISPVYEKLYEALDMLNRKNKLWYEAVMAYYGCNDSSYSIIAVELGVSKQTAYLRVRNGINYLRNIMIDNKK